MADEVLKQEILAAVTTSISGDTERELMRKMKIDHDPSRIQGWSLTQFKKALWELCQERSIIHTTNRMGERGVDAPKITILPRA